MTLPLERTLPLSGTVCRVIEGRSTRRAAGWLVENLLADSGVTALAVPDGAGFRASTALAASIVQALIAERPGRMLFGRRVLRTVNRVTLLATSERAAEDFRDLIPDPRLTVVTLGYWNGVDPGYWREIRDYTDGSDLIVVSTVQDLAPDAHAIAVERELGLFAGPVLAIYRGYESKPGGSNARWLNARARWWYSTKDDALVAVGSGRDAAAIQLPRILSLALHVLDGEPTPADPGRPALRVVTDDPWAAAVARSDDPPPF